MTSTQQDTREGLIAELGELCEKAWTDFEYATELFDRITALANTPFEADRRDAERYRWLRGPHGRIDVLVRSSGDGYTLTMLEGDELDSEIDAARTPEPSKEPQP